MCLVQQAPSDPDVVVQLSNRILSVQSTIYGRTFDVKSTDDPINIAYSPLPLELHQDIPYYESPAGLQLLHCMCFDPEIPGGQSTICDAFAAAEELRSSDYTSFHTLSRIPTCFQKVQVRVPSSPSSNRYCI